MKKKISIFLALMLLGNSFVYSASGSPTLVAPAAPEDTAMEFSEPYPTSRLEKIKKQFTTRLVRMNRCLRADSSCSKSETLKALRDVVVTIAALAALMYGAGHGFELIGESLVESGYGARTFKDAAKLMAGTGLQKTGAALKGPARAAVATAKRASPFKRKIPLTLPINDIVTYQRQKYYVIINDMKGKVGIAQHPEAEYFDWVPIADLDYFPTYKTYR